VIGITAEYEGVPYTQVMSPSIKTNRAAWLQGGPARCETTPHAINPYRLVLLGAPGVGKGTQAELLYQRLGPCHLSTGDVFRSVGSGSECALSPAMKEALSYMRSGSLVPDSTVWDMVRERKGCLHCGGGFILDGFPRTLAQAESLQQLMHEEGIALTGVVNYELPATLIVARLGGRRTCETCKAVYHVSERPPQKENVCDHCGGKLVQREDDRPESIQVRLEAYDRSTAPLIEYYEKRGLLIRVSANGVPDEIFENTVTQLESRRVQGVARKAWAAVENHRW